MFTRRSLRIQEPGSASGTDPAIDAELSPVEEEERTSQEDVVPTPGSEEDPMDDGRSVKDRLSSKDVMLKIGSEDDSVGAAQPGTSKRSLISSSNYSRGDAASDGAESRSDDGVNGSEDPAAIEININSFDALTLPDHFIRAAQDAWKWFLNSASSREAAGDAIFMAVYDSAPSMQQFFTSPRAIAAMRFVNGLGQLVMGLSDPPALKTIVEALGFNHLAMDVTIPRVHIFRDAILDLFQVELSNLMTPEAYHGWRLLLNYAGGAIIYIRTFYADRVKLLKQSWALANKDAGKSKAASLSTLDSEWSVPKQKTLRTQKSEEDHDETSTTPESMLQSVPTTFSEMFQFNAAVMGLGSNLWMMEILACFDNIVSNVSNSGRLIEECDVLVCRIAKVWTGHVKLADFKTCMLASLRSLLPKDWTTAHEVAWCWLWENVERTLLKNLGNPPIWEKAYAKLLTIIDEATGFQLRKDIYVKFFAAAPGGQDYFKMSNTYLYLIATKVLTMVLDMYREPARLVDDISATGLRHVGYAIPTEYMAPFATAYVDCIRGLTMDQNCIDGFQWSIGLLSKSMTRCILEGSTIVMKAINTNSRRELNKAVALAPRGERSQWMLLIQVGTQNISPLAWAIESGAIDSASAMIKDLFTIRADRDKYYYAADEVFTRHPDIVHMLLRNVPALVQELLDGLIWRSRITFQGLRRVNYYVRHLMVDLDGQPHKVLQWVSKARDPQLVCHPVLVLLSDKVWVGVAMHSFLFEKTWCLFVLIVFLLGQSIIEHWQGEEEQKTQRQLYALFVIRCFIYVVSMFRMLIHHVFMTLKALQKKEPDTVILFRGLRIPRYLQSTPESVSVALVLCLLIMFLFEPILHCFGDKSGILFNDACDGSRRYKFFPYSMASMVAILLYYTRLADLAVFSNRVSAYVLVCGRMLEEAGLFLVAFGAMLLTFSSAFSCLELNDESFRSIPDAFRMLWELYFQVLSEIDYRKVSESITVLIGCYVYLILIAVFLLNMLVAQLCSAYDAVYADMVGYARLKRIRIILESMPKVSPTRWSSFVRSMGFENALEFNEGDIGLANGIATVEPASANPTTVDTIRRYGGSTSQEMPWPKDDIKGDDESDRLGRLEKVIKMSTARILKSTGRRKSASTADFSMHSDGTGSSEGSSRDGHDE